MADATAADLVPEGTPVGNDSQDKKGQRRPERLKRLEKPDKAALDAEIAALNEAMDANQKRIQEIKAILESKQEGRKSISSEMQEARNRLQETTNRFKQALEEKKAIREEMTVVDQAREHARAAAKELKDKLPFVKVEQIDEEIKKLEYKMTHTSLSLNEEKKFVSQIKELTKSRDFVKDYSGRLEKIDDQEALRGAILERLKQKDSELNAIKALEQEQRQALNASRDKESSQSADMPSLHEEKQAKYEEIKALQKKVREMRTEFKAKEDEYWERERAVRKQEQEEKKARWEAAQVEKKKREEIWKARQAENYVPPFTDEIIKCEQLASMLQKYAPAAANAPTAAKTEVKAPEGASIIKSKKDRDEQLEGWFGGLGSGGKKGKGGKGAAAKEKATERLALSLDALQSFESVGVEAPRLVKDVGGAIDKLREKKGEFEAKQEEEAAKKEADDAASKEAAAKPPPVAVNGDAEKETTATEEKEEAVEVEPVEEPEKEAPAKVTSPKKSPRKALSPQRQNETVEA